MLRHYQNKFVENISIKLAEGKRKVVAQLSTGGGKTQCFSAISHRYTAKSPKSVLILVHRKELLQQTRKTLFNAFNISSQVIVAGMKYIPPAKVYVGMIESVMRRIPQIKDIGLVIIDEAHIAAFNKIHVHFPTQFIIGFTATPLSANKKHPMNEFYEDIVCGVDIPELIKDGHLCQNITIAPKDTVERSKLTIKNGEFDDHFMGQVFSKPRYINNTVQSYLKYAAGTKAIVFNVTMDHSRAVNDAFILAGLPSRHLDSTMSATERMHTLNWFKHTPGAILNNVGIATMGFDEPTIETVIVNSSMMSMPLWLQKCGRGSRPTETKSMFRILDMGENWCTLGDWDMQRDWEGMFSPPPRARDKAGVAPVKHCPGCDAIIAVQARECQHCGYLFPAKEQELEQELGEFVVVTSGIDVRAVIEANRARKEYYPFFKIGKDIAISAAKSIPRMDDEIAGFILAKYESLAKEWCHAVSKKYNQWHQERAREHLYNELAERFKKWENPLKKQEAA